MIVHNLALAELESWSRKLDLRDALAKYGPNTYILSEQQLEDNVREWMYFAGSTNNICYPVKANPSPAVLELLASHGCNAECASIAEIALAKRCGFSDQSILYHSPGLDIDMACEVLIHGGNVVVDSENQLDLLSDSLRSLKRDSSVDDADVGGVLVRLNPTIESKYINPPAFHKTTKLGNGSKFGVPSEDVVNILMNKKYDNVPIFGLHVHIGTQMDHAVPFIDAANHLAELAEQISSQTSHHITILDLGGGAGIPYAVEDKYPTISALGDALKPTLSKYRAHGYDFWFEPGQSLVGNTTGLLGSILYKKDIRGKKWAIASIGFDQLVTASHLGWFRPVMGPDHKILPSNGPDSIAGPLCFSGETISPKTDISSLKQGDPIFVMHTGAYCGAMANTFNGRRSGGAIIMRTDGTFYRTTAAATLFDEP